MVITRIIETFNGIHRKTITAGVPVTPEEQTTLKQHNPYYKKTKTETVILELLQEAPICKPAVTLRVRASFIRIHGIHQDPEDTGP